MAYFSLWQIINHEILANPNQIDMYSCLLLLLWIHTISDDTLLCYFKPVPTQFTLYAFIAYGYD